MNDFDFRNMNARHDRQLERAEEEHRDVCDVPERRRFMRDDEDFRLSPQGEKPEEEISDDDRPF